MEYYKIIEPINCGRYGGVYRARDKNNNIVAIKKLPFVRHDVNHFENNVMIQRESTNWKKISGKPNILQLKEFITNKDEAWFVSEYCSKGSLHEYSNQLYNDDNAIKHALKHILSGIVSCHTSDIAHCDLKPNNILLSDSYEWKLCDFGCSQESYFEDKGLFIKKGTPLFIAPELFGFDGYGKNVDVWAFGIIAYMLAHNGDHPFPWDANFKQHIIHGEYKWQNNYATKEFKDIVKLCLHPKAHSRISSEEALTHPYFK